MVADENDRKERVLMYLARNRKAWCSHPWSELWRRRSYPTAQCSFLHGLFHGATHARNHFARRGGAKAQSSKGAIVVGRIAPTRIAPTWVA